MSYWTQVNGIIQVSPFGRCQAEKRYIVDMVLSHLPKIYGLHIYVLQKEGYNSSCSHDEFGQRSNLGNGSDYFGQYRSFEMQEDYLIVVNGSLRDHYFRETIKDINKWLCRLAKRIWIKEILIEVKGEENTYLFNNYEPYYAMLEDPSWCNDTGEPNWCEAFMWNPAKNSEYPMLLKYKYYANSENDAEAERRIQYFKNS